MEITNIHKKELNSNSSMFKITQKCILIYTLSAFIPIIVVAIWLAAR